MKKILAATLVLGICAMVAQAAPAMNITITKTGTYTPTGITGGATVDVYTFHIAVTEGEEIGGVDLTIGTLAYEWFGVGDANGSDPFQIEYQTGSGKTLAHNMTPTPETCVAYLYDGTGGYDNQIAMDTHFLVEGLTGWLPAISAPTETNDRTLGSYTDDPASLYGKGDLYIAAPCPTGDEEASLDFAQVAVLQGTTVWARMQVSNTDGMIGWSWNGIIPEPATMTLLGLGALALIRRRVA